MAFKNFAFPLNTRSSQKGDITLADLVKAGTSATFELSHVTSGATNQLNMITSKGPAQQSHPFAASISKGVATVALSNNELEQILNGADGGNWDYVQAQWTVGTVDAGGVSNLTVIQGGSTSNRFGWPPN